MLTLACIDIGVVNLGFAVIRFEDPEHFDVLFADKIDITKFGCDQRFCELSHDNIMADWISHFTRSHKHLLEKSDKILIERQPPMGFRDAEQLLMHYYREKAVLIHPRSFHCHFLVSRLDYDSRKEMLVRKANRIYEKCNNVCSVLAHERAHDVADALLFAMYFVQTADGRKLLSARTMTRNDDGDIDSFFEQFIYRGRR